MGSHGKWDDYDIAFMIMVTVKHIMVTRHRIEGIKCDLWIDTMFPPL
jgi:hypothetical protein